MSTVKSKAVALVEVSRNVDIAKKNAASLMPANADTAQKIRDLEAMLNTPYVSGREAAANEAIVTILRVGEGEIEDMQKPGEFIPQYLYLVRFQTPVSYKKSTGELVDFEVGQVALIGLRKNGKRDQYARIVKEITDDGEVLPNLLVTTRPSTKPGWSPAITFEQLEPAS